MKLLRLCVSVLFVIVLVISAVFQILQLSVDKTLPQITVEGDRIEVRLDATDADLLVGVSAYDEKDGDLTEDEQKVAEKSIQDLTDKYIKEIDAITDAKQKEIMKI